MTSIRKHETVLGQGELKELATVTGASKTHLHFVLRGVRVPSTKLAQQIADHLGARTPASVLAVLRSAREHTTNLHAASDKEAQA